MSNVSRLLKEQVDRIHSNPNQISVSAYDTGWLAWVDARSRDWIIENQNADGSWGASHVEYYHDRVICTLSAINAIAATSTSKAQLSQVDRGVAYLSSALPNLDNDVSDLAGFELLVPCLLDIASDQGIDLSSIQSTVEPILRLRDAKVARIPHELLYEPASSMVYSLEFVGFGGLDTTRASRLYTNHGGVGCSPAATAFLRIATQSKQPDAYLDRVLNACDGASPCFYPLEIYEALWSIAALSYSLDAGEIKEHFGSLLVEHLAHFSKNGIGWTKGAPPDLDCTSTALLLAHEIGREFDSDALDYFETEERFQCYPFERNASIDAHVHLVQALSLLPDFPRKDAMQNKALNVLKKMLTDDFVIDKWHISPYYSTSHAVLGLIQVDSAMVEPLIGKLVQAQREDGTWLSIPACPAAAVEETAHALMALLEAYARGYSIPFSALERGARFLESSMAERDSRSLPELWIAKTLNCPYNIVESAIVGAIAKFDRLS